MHEVVACMIALSFGLFTLVNLLGECIRPGFDASVWWLDLRALPQRLTLGLLLLASIALLGFALRPRMSSRRRVVSVLIIGMLIGVSLWNSVVFVVLLSRGAITSDFPVPCSLLVVVALAHVGWSLCRGEGGGEGRIVRSTWPHQVLGLIGRAAALVVCLIVFPLAQIYCFGMTDYRRRADAIVVFGCLAYADGTPSTSLADRVRTACELYHAGLAERFIVSGGPSAGDVHETEVMRALAIELDVPADAILVDRDGLDTLSTVDNTTELFESLGVERVLAVSHFYHLPRIKLCYQRRGLQAFTVPARESRWIPKTPYSVGREVVALWYYYLRPLVG